MSQEIIFGVGGFSKCSGKRMLFTKRAVAQRLPKAESWHEAHFEAHREEINLTPRFQGLKMFQGVFVFVYFCLCSLYLRVFAKIRIQQVNRKSS